MVAFTGAGRAGALSLASARAACGRHAPAQPRWQPGSPAPGPATKAQDTRQWPRVGSPCPPELQEALPGVSCQRWHEHSHVLPHTLSPLLHLPLWTDVCPDVKSLHLVMGTRHAATILPQPRCLAGQPPMGLSLQSLRLEGGGCWRAGAGAAKWHRAPAWRQWCQTGMGAGACHLRQVQHVLRSWRGWRCLLFPHCTGCPHAPPVSAKNAFSCWQS